MSIGVQKLREIGVNHLKQAGFLHLGHQIGLPTGLQNRSLDTAGFTPARATQDTQVPQAQQPLHHLVIDVAVVHVPQLDHDPGQPVFRILPSNSFQNELQVNVLLLVVHLVALYTTSTLASPRPPARS